MKTAADIERLLVAARKQHNKALKLKLNISKADPHRVTKRDDANRMLLASGTAIAVMEMILDRKRLTDEDVRYFLSDCG